jgi:hypothetical protein
MFDPHHNARDSYYLARGSLQGSWEGLPKEVCIMNWNGQHAAESLRFFSDRGHPQIIAGYYDGPLENTRQWLRKAKGISGILGVMFTTWHSNYSELENFAKMLDEEGW